jgi:SpoVK/Ycf46/Vps4 family AAA+-type ATPase
VGILVLLSGDPPDIWKIIESFAENTLIIATAINPCNLPLQTLSFFPNQFYLDLPSWTRRSAIWAEAKQYLSKEQFETLVRNSKGATPADIVGRIRDAHMSAVREYLKDKPDTSLLPESVPRLELKYEYFTQEPCNWSIVPNPMTLNYVRENHIHNHFWLALDDVWETIYLILGYFQEIFPLELTHIISYNIWYLNFAG